MHYPDLKRAEQIVMKMMGWLPESAAQNYSMYRCLCLAAEKGIADERERCAKVVGKIGAPKQWVAAILAGRPNKDGPHAAE